MSFRICMKKADSKTPLGRPRRRRKGGVKQDLEETGGTGESCG